MKKVLIPTLMILLSACSGGSGSGNPINGNGNAVIVGGECTQPVVVELGAHPSIEGVINDSEITISRPSDPGNPGAEEYFADLNSLVSLPAVAKPYMELTIKSAVKAPANMGAGPRIAVAAATVELLPWPHPVTAVGLHIFPTDGIVEFVVQDSSNVPAFSQALNFPYTVGLWIDSSGIVFYQDSMGNGGQVGTHADFQVPADIVLGIGVQMQEVGESAVVEANLGERPFRLSPPVGSEDFCGNTLN